MEAGRVGASTPSVDDLAGLGQHVEQMHVLNESATCTHSIDQRDHECCGEDDELRRHAAGLAPILEEKTRVK